MKNEKAKQFFSEPEVKKIEELVKKAELETSGEIAIMLADESDSYREAETLGALLFSSFIALIIAVAIHHVTIWSFIPLVLIFWFPAYYSMRVFPRLKLAFVGKKRLEEAVRERAVRAFFEKGLYRTRDETGILIFISLLEHKVWILGDRGINQKIDQQLWFTVAGELAERIREGRAFEGLCTVIQKLCSILAEHFPQKTGDKNELPDKMLF